MSSESGAGSDCSLTLESGGFEMLDVRKADPRVFRYIQPEVCFRTDRQICLNVRDRAQTVGCLVARFLLCAEAVHACVRRAERFPRHASRGQGQDHRPRPSQANHVRRLIRKTPDPQ